MSNKPNVKYSIQDLEKRIGEMKKKYSIYLEEKERKRKREQDQHFTQKDQRILVKSIVLANLIEMGFKKIII